MGSWCLTRRQEVCISQLPWSKPRWPATVSIPGSPEKWFKLSEQCWIFPWGQFLLWLSFQVFLPNNKEFPGYIQLSRAHCFNSLVAKEGYELLFRKPSLLSEWLHLHLHLLGSLGSWEHMGQCNTEEVGCTEACGLTPCLRCSLLPASSSQFSQLLSCCPSVPLASTPPLCSPHQLLSSVSHLLSPTQAASFLFSPPYLPRHLSTLVFF